VHLLVLLLYTSPSFLSSMSVYHSSSNHILCSFSSLWPSLAEILTLSQALSTFPLSCVSYRAANLFQILLSYWSLSCSFLTTWDWISPCQNSVLLVYLLTSLPNFYRYEAVFSISVSLWSDIKHTWMSSPVHPDVTNQTVSLLPGNIHVSL
jgi:hypothetical protein